MEFETIDIRELLPQREPFVMVGKLKCFDDSRTVTETRITEDNIFVEAGVFSSSGIIENIAQTCAARIGYINKYILKKGIQLGFIGAIRGLTISRLPSVGEVIETTVVIQEEVFGMTLVTASVMSGGMTVAEAQMKIALGEEEAQHAC